MSVNLGRQRVRGKPPPSRKRRSQSPRESDLSSAPGGLRNGAKRSKDTSDEKCDSSEFQLKLRGQWSLITGDPRLSLVDVFEEFFPSEHRSLAREIEDECGVDEREDCLASAARLLFIVYTDRPDRHTWCYGFNKTAWNAAVKREWVLSDTTSNGVTQKHLWFRRWLFGFVHYYGFFRELHGLEVMNTLVRVNGAFTDLARIVNNYYSVPPSELFYLNGVFSNITMPVVFRDAPSLSGGDDCAVPSRADCGLVVERAGFECMGSDILMHE